MSAEEWPDWLPGDWTIQLTMKDHKKFKTYVTSEGHKLYSKPQVLEHLKKTNKSTAIGNTNADVSQAPESTPPGRSTRLATGSINKKFQGTDGSLAGDGSSSEPHSSQRDDGISKWLPDGWTEEVRTRKGGGSIGTKYKIFTDPVSGQKFFSKPQVLTYLAKTNNSPTAPKEVSTLGEKSPTEVKNNGTGKKASAKFSAGYEVISRSPADGLPLGWIKEVRVRKGNAKKKDPYYLDPLSDYTFFSKKDVTRYLESGDVKSCVIKPLKRDISLEDANNVTLALTEGQVASPSDPSKGTGSELVSPSYPSKGTEALNALPNGSENRSENKRRSITGGSFPTPDTSRREARAIARGNFSISDASPKEGSDWLPDGWTVEVHAKSSGQKYKIFKETSSGRKFYSKPQVLSYLGLGSSSNSVKRKADAVLVTPISSQAPISADSTHAKRSRKKKDNTPNSDFREEISTSAADGLPPGWIKEIRTKIYATHSRNDPYYTDPLTGYIFRSKLDALRYIETGDVNLCAIRPKVKDKDGNEVLVYTHDVQKPVKTTNVNQLFEGNKGDGPTDAAVPVTETPARGRGRPRKLAPSTMPDQSAKRQKGINLKTDPAEENGTVQEKQGSGLNLEKQADDDRLSFQIEEAENWTDTCLDFAVKTLTDEILFNGQPSSSSFPEGNGGVGAGPKETPTKVN